MEKNTGEKANKMGRGGATRNDGVKAATILLIEEKKERTVSALLKETVFPREHRTGTEFSREIAKKKKNNQKAQWICLAGKAQGASRNGPAVIPMKIKRQKKDTASNGKKKKMKKKKGSR